jgi:glutamate carboxypeptidase
MEDHLGTLVGVNSFTDHAEGGAKVGTLLQELFTIDGVTCEVVPSQRYAPHLVFRTQSRLGGVAPVALVGHLDTVFPPGTFEGMRRDGDLLRGPGVLDMKGGLVVVAYALRALSETVGLENVPPLVIVVVADEEVGSPEGQAIIRRAVAGDAPKASACLVFEAGRTSDLIITRRKGTGSMVVRFAGKAAHAGLHHRDGANAIWALAKFIDAAQGLTRYDAGVTVNVGKVAGGIGKNTVPDAAEGHLDIRFDTKADGDALVAALHEAARAATVAVAGTSFSVEGGITRLPLERTAESAQLFEEYGRAASAAGLGSGEAPLVAGASDASTSSVLGIPSIDGLGPRGLGFHTKDERIERASLVPKAQALARFLAARGQQR